MPEHWKDRMGVYRLNNADVQPYYNVIVEDGSNRYAAEENLTPNENSSAIPHVMIGKYFKEFTGQYYVPNEELKAHYPDDDEIREQFIRDMKWN